MKGAIVIPAFNEGQVIDEVIKKIPNKINDIKLDILVVNDGSSDNTAMKVRQTGTKIISHFLNRGVGAATKTGLIWAQKNDYDFAVTFDADGQHDPTDLEAIIQPISEGKADLVIGSRLKNGRGMPVDRFAINWLANLFTFIMYGVFSTDTQSGLRTFSKKALSLIDFRGEGYDFSSEILLIAMQNKLVIKEVPTSSIYTEYSRKKGQKNSNIFKVGQKLIMKIFR